MMLDDKQFVITHACVHRTSARAGIPRTESSASVSGLGLAPVLLGPLDVC